ncbi:MAG: hypothetical protein LQ346_005961 [Caloplaca aetnensis]|nr:MAG: hypothetical protein LQ346_005961 [Caloplaca aetnensis]
MNHVFLHHRLGHSLSSARPDFQLYTYLWKKHVITDAIYRDIKGNSEDRSDLAPLSSANDNSAVVDWLLMQVTREDIVEHFRTVHGRTVAVAESAPSGSFTTISTRSDQESRTRRSSMTTIPDDPAAEVDDRQSAQPSVVSEGDKKDGRNPLNVPTVPEPPSSHGNLSLSPVLSAETPKHDAPGYAIDKSTIQPLQHAQGIIDHSEDANTAKANPKILIPEGGLTGEVAANSLDANQRSEPTRVDKVPEKRDGDIGATEQRRQVAFVAEDRKGRGHKFTTKKTLRTERKAPYKRTGRDRHRMSWLTFSRKERTSAMQSRRKSPRIPKAVSSNSVPICENSASHPTEIGTSSPQGTKKNLTDEYSLSKEFDPTFSIPRIPNPLPDEQEDYILDELAIPSDRGDFSITRALCKQSIPRILVVPKLKQYVTRLKSFGSSCASVLANAAFPEIPVAAGKRRIRWTCSCGSRLYDDFVELRPGAAKELEAALDAPSQQRTSGQPSASSNQSLSMQPLGTDASASSTSAPTGLSVPANTASYNPRPLDGRPNSTTITCDPESKWLLVCAQAWQRPTSLMHLSSEVSDTSRDLVDVRKVPDMPPESRKEEYLYQTCDLLPPIGENLMTHLFHHPHEANEKAITFIRSPKKRKQRLVVCPQMGTSLGWGIHLVEGWAWTKIWLLSLTLMLLSSLVFAISWSVLKHDLQGAFGVAAYFVALVALGIGTVQAYINQS